MTTNKLLKNLFGKWDVPVEPLDSAKVIGWTIRDGLAFKLPNPKSVNEMFCVDCQGARGFVCWHEGEYAWMCISKECLNKSVEISKTKERNEWIKKINVMPKKKEGYA